MTAETAWMNGEIISLADARVGIEDRGFQFADGVYEVIRFYGGSPFTLDRHLARLLRSAGGIQLALPMTAAALDGEIRRFIAGRGLLEGMIYLQLTRGCAARNHAFPECRPRLLFYARELEPMADTPATQGAKLLSVADERWKRCWIKSIALLPNVLAKNQALATGADEAVFIDDGIVTECSASNIFFVMRGRLVTHPVGPKVLPGITREVLLEIAAQLAIAVEERPAPESQAMAADEIFITSTTREVSWVEAWNGRVVGGGKCGDVTRRLHGELRRKIRGR